MSHPVGGEFLGNNYGNIEDAEIEAAGGDELIFCNAATTSATLAVNAKLSATTVIAGTEVTLTLSSELEQEEVLDMYDYGHIFVLVYSIEATITFGGKTYTTTLDAGDVNDMTSLTYIASPDATVKLTTTGLTGK